MKFNPKKTALQWAAEYKNNTIGAPAQKVAAINDKIEHPTQEGWLRIPLQRGFDKTTASKIALHLADPHHGANLPVP